MFGVSRYECGRQEKREFLLPAFLKKLFLLKKTIILQRYLQSEVISFQNLVIEYGCFEMTFDFERKLWCGRCGRGGGVLERARRRFVGRCWSHFIN